MLYFLYFVFWSLVGWVSSVSFISLSTTQPNYKSLLVILNFDSVLEIARFGTKIKIKNERLLVSLRRDRLGNALCDTTRHILNLSDYVLSGTGRFVLSNGLNFGLPPRYLCKEEIFAEFESLWAQIYIAVSVLLNNALL